MVLFTEVDYNLYCYGCYVHCQDCCWKAPVDCQNKWLILAHLGMCLETKAGLSWLACNWPINVTEVVNSKRPERATSDPLHLTSVPQVSFPKWIRYLEGPCDVSPKFLIHSWKLLSYPIPPQCWSPKLFTKGSRFSALSLVSLQIKEKGKVRGIVTIYN